MPTGYTAKLMDEGQSFDEFVLTCARAFGALITLRDEPLDAPIPDELQPSAFYMRELEKAKAQSMELSGMSADQRLAFGINRKAEQIERLAGYLRRDEEQNAVLYEMKARVLRWQPPTADHQELKDFMLDQLRKSEHDLTWSAKELAEARKKDPMEFYAAAVKEAAWSAQNYAEESKKELERTRQRNEWVRHLRESLRSDESSSPQ